MDDKLILLTSSLAEIGPCHNDADFAIGTGNASNDFVLYGSLPEGTGGVYVPGTEWGGVIEYMQETNGSDTCQYKGWTWRGLLSQAILTPPSGSDYLTVSGDANTVLGTILSGVLGGFFHVPSTSSGITISSYQFKLYCTALDGIADMLATAGAKLCIHADKVEAGQPIQVTVEAKPAETLGTVYTGESPVGMTYTDNGMGINHLVCMGRGELQSRQRADLYVNASGAIVETKYFTGFAERTAYFDYSSAESLAELEKAGRSRLLEIMSSTSLQVNDIDLDGDIGDKVYGYMHGKGVTSPIVSKVLTIKGDIWTVESKI